MRTPKQIIYNSFCNGMMSAPPIALDLQYFKDILKQVVLDYRENNTISVAEANNIRKKIAKEFIWFDPKEDEDGEGGYYQNLDNPKLLKPGNLLYKILKIKNSKKEQKNLRDLYKKIAEQKTEK